MAAVGPDDRVANVRPSPAREDDHTPAAAVAAGHLEAIRPPDSCDLREPWYAIGDQGKTGSCVGWALADSVMWRQLVRAGRLGEQERLSPRFIWMAAKEMRARLTDATGETDWRPSTFLEQGDSDFKSALDVARTYGAALERDLPWEDGLYPGDMTEFYDSAAARMVTHYYRLDPEEETVAQWFDHWRRWIHQHGPVLLAVGLDTNFVEGAPLLDAFDPASVSRYHAAALVGYAPNGFLIRCSWGLGWGRNGYAVATEGYLEQATLESYGVVV